MPETGESSLVDELVDVLEGAGAVPAGPIVELELPVG